MIKKRENMQIQASRPSTSPGALRRWWGRSLLFLLVVPALTACDDDFYTVHWEESPDTAIIYSLARPELNLYSGFDFLGRTGVKIESPQAVGKWDMALDTRGGDLVFLPPRAIGVRDSDAALVQMGDMAFEDLKRAPRDTTLYVSDKAVPIHVGELYVIRSRKSAGSYGSACSYFGKFVPLAKDIEGGSVTIMFDMSPVCNNRKLIPPKD
jgi:hypothetical protein